MPLEFFIKGFAIGLAIAAPVGPIGVLCIRRSLAEGRRVGLATGLGAATADAAYGCIAAFGLTAFSGFLVAQRVWLGLIGGAFLCCLGVRTLTSKPPERAPQPQVSSLASAYFSTVILTLTNPMTILSFAAVFMGLGLTAAPDYLAAAAVVVGVFSGSTSWWVLLSSGVAMLRSHITPRWMQGINAVSGIVLLAFGIYAVTRYFLG